MPKRFLPRSGTVDEGSAGDVRQDAASWTASELPSVCSTSRCNAEGRSGTGLREDQAFGPSSEWPQMLHKAMRVGFLCGHWTREGAIREGTNLSYCGLLRSYALHSQTLTHSTGSPG